MLSVAQDIQNQIAPYQAAINTSLSVATSLPLVGHQLESLQDLSTLLQNRLVDIQQATQGLGNGHHQITITLPALSPHFTFDLGLDALLQVSASGDVVSSITPKINIGFDISGTSATLDVANTNLDIAFSLSLPNFQATMSLNHLLYVHAADQGTTFAGDLTFGFNSASNVSPQFSGDAHVRLGLTMSFVDPALNASFNPTFRTNFQLDWGLDTATSKMKVPQIAFKDFSLDADSFLHGFIGDIATTVQKYTKPLQPFIDKFDTPVPILSAFDSSETIGDLLLQGAGLTPDQQDRFNLMVKVIKAVNTLDLSGSTGGAAIDFGDINLSGATVTSDGDLGSVFGFDTSQLQNAIQQIFDSPAMQDLQNTLEDVANYTGANAQGGLQFPILENPGPIIGGILTGNVQTMFSFTTGREHFELAPSIGFGIPDLFGVFLTAGITFDADLSIGYDTAGLIKFVQDSQHKPEDLLHGFYFDNSVDTSAPPIPNVSQPRKTAFYLQGFAELSASAVLTLSGGIYANISVELVNPDNSPHVYLDTMLQNIGSPASVFNASGQLYAAASISITVPNPIGPNITLFSYELARKTLLDYDPPPPVAGAVPVVVIDVTDQHTLELKTAQMSGVGGVTVQPFHNMSVLIGGQTVVADGIRVDYPGEIDLYIERKNDFTTNYYNFIGLDGSAPDGASIQITDPFRVFKDEQAADPEPAQTAPGVLLVGGRSVTYNYIEASDDAHAKVLLAGGYGSNTLFGGTMEFGNFIPAPRIDQAKQHFGDISGYDPAGQTLINTQIAGLVAPADPTGIIGATLEANRGGLMLGGPGNDSFYANGPGNYEMIGGAWYNTFSISPSFGGVPATYQIDGGPFGKSQLALRVPAGENVTLENSTIDDKYNPTLKALEIDANAGLSATAHGLRTVKVITASGSAAELGDTSKLNIDFSISGGGRLKFGGTDAPDTFDVTTTGSYYDYKNHFSAPKYGYDENGVLHFPGNYGIILPTRQPDPVYYITRTFGTNGRTETVPFTIDDANSGSIELDGGKAIDTYDITMGVGAFVNVAVNDSDTTTQNVVNVNVRDSNLVKNSVTLTDNVINLDYYTEVVFQDLIPVGIQGHYVQSSTSSVHYQTSVFFNGNNNVTLGLNTPFFQTIVNRSSSADPMTIVVDGQYYTSFIPYQSFGPQNGTVFDGTLAIPGFVTFPTFYHVDVQANDAALTIKYQNPSLATTCDVHSNFGTLALDLFHTFDGSHPLVNTFNVFSNGGILTIDAYLTGIFGSITSTAHVINVLGNTGEINLQFERADTAYFFSVPENQVNIGAGSVANVHGTISISSQYAHVAQYRVTIDDTSGTDTRNWSFDPLHIQIGDLTIVPSTLNQASGFGRLAASWRVGTHATLIDSSPFLSTLYNGSSNFPLAWYAPLEEQNFETDSIDFPINSFAQPPTGTLTYAATNLPPGLSINSATGEITGTIPLLANLHSPYHTVFSVTNGTYTAIVHCDWLVSVTVALGLNSDAPIRADEGAPLQISYYAFNAIDRPVTVTAQGLPAWLTLDTDHSAIKGTPPVGASANTPYHIVLHADDGQTTVDFPFDLLVNGTTFNPVQDLRYNRIGDAVDFSVTATTTSGRPLVYSSNNLPTGVAIDSATGRITGTLAGNIPQTTRTLIDIAVSDGLFTQHQTFTWDIIPANTVDVLTIPSPGPQTSKAGDAVSLRVAALSSLFLDLRYSITGLPNASISANGTITKTFSSADVAGSPYHVTVSANDGVNTAQVTFDWVVTGTRPITVQPFPTLTSSSGGFFNSRINATTTSGLPLSYSATGLPPGVSINAQTGFVSGTLGALNAYPTVFLPIVTVTDGTNTTSVTFQWTITWGPAPNVVVFQVPFYGSLQLVSPANTQLTASISTTPSGPIATGIDFPFGYFTFDITPLNNTALQPGASTTLTINGPAVINNAYTYFKYGPTPANSTPHWYNFMYNQKTDGDDATGTGVQVVSSTQLVLHFIEGGRGDDDLTKNGIIHDLGGPAIIVPVPALPGDYNGDHTVNASDYVLWRNTLGQTAAYPYAGADGNGDGTVNQADYDVWRSHFGQTSGGGAAEGTASGAASGTAALSSPLALGLGSSPHASLVDSTSMASTLSDQLQSNVQAGASSATLVDANLAPTAKHLRTERPGNFAFAPGNFNTVTGSQRLTHSIPWNQPSEVSAFELLLDYLVEPTKVDEAFDSDKYDSFSEPRDSSNCSVADRAITELTLRTNDLDLL